MFRAGKRIKERLPRYARNDKKYSPEERGDLDCSALANREKRDCFAGNIVIASGAWRSRLFRAGKRKKERLLRKLAMTNAPVIARNEAISPFHNLQTEKREIASQARNPAKGR